jgi:serine/threonine-protein kinase
MVNIGPTRFETPAIVVAGTKHGGLADKSNGNIKSTLYKRKSTLLDVNPDRRRQIQELYREALDRPASERASFLAQACSSDTDLRSEVESLLAQEGQAGELLESPAWNHVAPGTTSVPARHKLTPGSELGAFRVVELLGAGGMGEVYRATDTKLGREVAIKVLPEAFAQDVDRMTRFRREARVLASLNHPNIAAIYGMEENAIVMELVEGAELRGPLPLEKALDIARHIAGAIEAAHEKGIVHRDLKPANIKITTEGLVKVLDFGLAKGMLQTPVSVDPQNSSSTLTISGTRAGMVIGTAAYMSPEQARGQAADFRADIWAFGALLYELLTGDRPFHGESSIDVLVAVLQKEPDWNSLPAATPSRVRELLRCCLAKDRKLRLQAIGDARIFLTANWDEAVVAPPVSRRQILPWVAAGVFAAVAVTAFWKPWTPAPAAADRPFLQLDLDVGPDGFAHPAISPDGMRIVFVSKGVLSVRRLDQPKTSPLAGTENAAYPFFSPNGQWVAFFAEGKLKKIALEGGVPITLCDAPRPGGGTWGADDRIIAALDTAQGLSQLSAAGGMPEQLTESKADPSKTVRHLWPQALPGGKGVLFAATDGTSRGTLQIFTPSNGKLRTVVENSTFGRYLAGGYLVYYQRETLFAVPMDVGRLELTGTPVPLVSGVSAYGTGGRPDFDLSSTTLLYRGGAAGTRYVMSWLYPTGKIEPVLSKPGNYVTPRLSPDGTRLAISILQEGKQNIWIYNLRSESLTRLTSGAEPELLPTWSPDAEFIVFKAGNTLAWTRSDGSGKVERLAGVSRNSGPWSFSADGMWLAFWPLQTDSDLWIVPAVRTGSLLALGAPQSLLEGMGTKGAPALSPDGRWLAYTSNESGTFEIYVTPFSVHPTGRGATWMVSNRGGFSPVWSRSGTLFYQGPGNRIEVATFAVNGDSLAPAKPRIWSETPLADTGLLHGFDPAPDGNRVLATFGAEAPKPETLMHVLLNVDSELRRRAPLRAK